MIKKANLREKAEIDLPDLNYGNPVSTTFSGQGFTTSSQSLSASNTYNAANITSNP